MERQAILTWLRICKDIRGRLDLARRAVEAGRLEEGKRRLDRVRGAKKLNDTMFDKVCQELQKAIESGRKCPCCGHRLLIRGECVVKGNIVEIDMYCPACGTPWLDKYRYFGHYVDPSSEV